MKVLANDGISPSAIELLQRAGIEIIENKVAQEQLANFINENDIDTLLVRSATKVRKDLIDACPNLKIIGRGGVGLDNIDVELAHLKGIKVINTPFASSRSVAEMVFGHLLSLVRNLHDSNRTMPLEGDSNFSGLKKAYSKAYELQGKTMGIVGFGGIGREVAKIAISLGMSVKVFDLLTDTRTISLNFYDGQKVDFSITPTNNWDEFLPSVDFISINTHKTNGYLIDTPQFEKMKTGVFIINTARGGVINENALLEFIENGIVAGAGLDVFENEPTPETKLLMNPALSLSPHLAGNTVDAQEKIGIELAEQLIKLNQ